MVKSGLNFKVVNTWSKNGQNRSKPVNNMVEMSRYADPFLTHLTTFNHFLTTFWPLFGHF
jgi:hypothetical protein